MLVHGKGWLRQPLAPVLAITIIMSVSVVLNYALAGPPKDSLDYCPNRTPDQQYGASLGPEKKSGAVPEPGCVPFVEKKETKQDDTKPVKPRRPLKIENFQSEVSTFLQKYRQFLDCCKTDIAELDSIEDLGDDVADLLQLAQSGLFSEQMKLRGFTLREIIPPVAKAREDLRGLRKKLEQIGESIDKRETIDYEGAGKETLVIQEMEDGIQKEFRSTKPLSGPKTGLDIGATPAAGREIGKVPADGTNIKDFGSTGRDIGITPKTGREIGGTGPTGFEIGATGRAGPEIGESNLNSDSSSNVGSTFQRSTVGSDLQNSTVGSTFGASTIDSDLKDSTVGSSFGNSSVGSSLQNRGTAPR